MKRSVRRSGLMMPINNPRFVSTAWTRNADVITLDLEDAVPWHEKARARTLVKGSIPLAAKGGAEVLVRINLEFVEADLEATIWPGLSGIMHPKTEKPEQIRFADAVITRLERQRGIRPGSIEVQASIENAIGIAHAYEIASSSPRIRNFRGGSGYDMSLDLGVDMFTGIDQFFYGRGESELVARALGLQWTGGIPLQTQDTSGVVSDGDRAYLSAVANRKAGFRYGGGLHPNVVEPSNRGLTPPSAELEEAREILRYYATLEDTGEAVGEYKGRVVDKYEAQRAAELLQWAEACAEKDERKAWCRARAEAAT